MPTMERAKDVLRGVLDRGGVRDRGELTARGYRVTERELYVHAVARVLRNKARYTWDEDEIVIRALAFCAAIGDDYRRPNLSSYALPGGMWLVANEWGSGLNLAGKPDRWTGDTMRPSVRVDGVVTDASAPLPDEDMRVWAEELAQAARALAGDLLGNMVDPDCVRVSHPQGDRWDYRFSMRNGSEWRWEVGEASLRHDDRDRLLDRLRRHMVAELEANAEHLSGTDDVSQLRELMQKACEDKGITGRVRIVPGVRLPYERVLKHRVLLDGYGPTGLPATVHVFDNNATMIADAVTRKLTPLVDALAEQLRRQKSFGPHPGSVQASDWQVDRPTASRVAGDRRALAVLIRIASGEPSDAGDTDLEFKIKDRRILGTWEIAPGVTWKGDRLEVKRAALSDTVANALIGQSVRKIVDNKHLSDDDIIKRVERKSGKMGSALIAHVEVKTEPVTAIRAPQ